MQDTVTVSDSAVMPSKPRRRRTAAELVYETRLPRQDTPSHGSGSRCCGGESYSSMPSSVSVRVSLSHRDSVTSASVPSAHQAPADAAPVDSHAAPTVSVSPARTGNSCGVTPPPLVHDALGLLELSA